MFIKNGLVKCVGYNREERYFTIGKVYPVVNNRILSDTGHVYNQSNGYICTVDWLSRWYIFEVVECNDTFVCSICGETVNAQDVNMVDDEIFCRECFENNVVFCEDCGRPMLEDDAHYVNDRAICESCLDNNYVVCDECGELVHRYDSYWTQNRGRVCEYCAENYFHTCSDCGDLVHEDDCVWDDNDNVYCPDCYDDIKNRAIHPYGYKPTPIFYGTALNQEPLYMGVELEVDRGGEDGENAQTILDVMNEHNEHIYIKHDGSLNEGFEIVSHPATLAYHTNCMKWEKVMEAALEMGYRSHDTDTCGLHVHVSRKALGDTYEKQEETVSKILYFIENNWSKILRFTRRTESNLRHWANRYGIESDIETTYEKAKGNYSRYTCLNLQNTHTIEFRVFRGTLKYSTFLATLQLVYNICDICINSTVDDISKMKWNTFVSRIDSGKYPELMEYLASRDLDC